MTTPDTAGFYGDLTPLESFTAFTRADTYVAFPADWLIGMSDVVGSTKAIADGNYKTVNMVGAAIISAMINTTDGLEFPFIFGGDGATFAIPPNCKDAAVTQMAAVRAWAKREFQLELRAAIIPVSEVHKAGHQVAVARFAASNHVDYAMFRGSGVSWAEKQMKSGNFSIPEPAPVPGGDVPPDLTGLSCRWTSMRSRNGSIVSLIAVPAKAERQDEFDGFAQALIAVVEQSERGCRPIPDAGPGVSWPPEGLALEAHASRGRGSLMFTKAKLLAGTLLAWIIFKTNLKAGGFDPVHYQQTTGMNADFRKFEEGLKMTLDCSPPVRDQLVAMLDNAEKAGILRYGIHEQEDCMMTCIVPSIMTDDHIHFIDGAKGGYTAAAMQMKAG